MAPGAISDAITAAPVAPRRAVACGTFGANAYIHGRIGMAVTGLRIRKIKPAGAAVIGLFFLFAVFSWDKTTGTYSTAHLAHAVDTPTTKPSAPASRNLPDFVSLVKKIGPSVVNIATMQAQRPAQGMPSPFGDPGSNDPWERFFGGQSPRSPQRQRGLGSGFIIDSDGTIVTNNHVVNGAEKIVVTLADGKSFDAKILGTDQKSDIAILKIDAQQRFTGRRLGRFRTARSRRVGNSHRQFFWTRSHGYYRNRQRQRAAYRRGTLR